MPDAVLAAGRDRLAGEHVDDGLLEGGGDVGDGHRLTVRLPALDPAGDRGLQSGEREVVAVPLAGRAEP